MNKAQLVEAVAQDSGVDAKQVNQVLSSLLDTIVRTVADGENVTLTNFGTWLSVDVPARKARNPQNGERFTVPAHRAMRYRVLPTTVELVKRAKSTYQGVPITVAKRGKGNDSKVPTVANVRLHNQ